MLEAPRRSDFTSEPASAMPASNTLRISYSKRARRFSAMVLRGGPAGALAIGGPGELWRLRDETGAGKRLADHAAGILAGRHHGQAHLRAAQPQKLGGVFHRRRA